jgi:hypothetical protein
MTPQALDELEFNLLGGVSLECENPRSTDFSVESGNIGANELERFTSPKIQQKWRFE